MWNCATAFVYMLNDEPMLWGAGKQVRGGAAAARRAAGRPNLGRMGLEYFL